MCNLLYLQMDNKHSSLAIRHTPIIVGETVINVHSLNLQDSVMLWVNGERISTENLVMAIATKFSVTPSSVYIQGDYSNQHSASFATKFCRKFGKQCYISWNLPNVDTQTAAQVENEIFRVYSSFSSLEE